MKATEHLIMPDSTAMVHPYYQLYMSVSLARSRRKDLSTDNWGENMREAYEVLEKPVIGKMTMNRI